MSFAISCLHSFNRDVNEENATDVTTVENDDFEIIFLMCRGNPLVLHSYPRGFRPRS